MLKIAALLEEEGHKEHAAFMYLQVCLRYGLDPNPISQLCTVGNSPKLAEGARPLKGTEGAKVPLRARSCCTKET